MEMVEKSKSELAAADIAGCLRARQCNLWVVTQEEARVEPYLFEAAASVQYLARTWDVAQGVCEIDGKLTNIGSPDPAATLDTIRDRAKSGGDRGVWILRDMPAWLNGPAGATVLRQMRNLARSLPNAPLDSAQAMIVISPSGDIPPELAGQTTVIEWPLPDRSEIGELLDAAEATSDKIEKSKNGNREAVIDAAIGLSGEEAYACFARSLVQQKRVVPAIVAAEKKRVVAREKVLEWFDPLKGGLDAVGGLEALKQWLRSRVKAYDPRARAYGLPAPRGIVLVGMSGCGKSMTAKAIATAFGVPLLRLDLGSLKSEFVGKSEATLRKALRVIEAIGRCVVWIDEIEKALEGAVSGSADGGVSADQLGTVLNWMQERAGDAFVVCTANDVSKLPPELLRKGRFDDLFFVDLPNTTERQAVLASALRTHSREKAKIDVEAVALECKEFTGAEIAALVPDALYVAFGDGEREITTADLITAARSVVPLAQTAKAKVEALRTWGKANARPASLPEEITTTTRRKRVLDIA
jgi:ATP-dependent 26S proteasome regulatory subunit